MRNSSRRVYAGTGAPDFSVGRASTRVRNREMSFRCSSGASAFGGEYAPAGGWLANRLLPRRRHSGLLGGTGLLARLPRNPSDGWAD